MKSFILKINILCFLCLISYGYAQQNNNGLGQVLQITTRLHYFVGRPSWTLIIRDLDHNQNMPYLFDISRGDNHWVVFTYGTNYLITASRLQIETYQSKYNTYKQYRLNNFCHLESNGRIRKGESMYITIEGGLSPYNNSFSCHVSSYPDRNFFIVKSDL